MDICESEPAARNQHDAVSFQRGGGSFDVDYKTRSTRPQSHPARRHQVLGQALACDGGAASDDNRENRKFSRRSPQGTGDSRSRDRIELNPQGGLVQRFRSLNHIGMLPGPHPEEHRRSRCVSKDGRNAWIRGHPSRRRAKSAAPQSMRIYRSPHPEEHRRSRCVSKDGRKAWTRGHPSRRRAKSAAPQDEVRDRFTSSQDEVPGSLNRLV
jgi:hypothetical protein